MAIIDRPCAKCGGEIPPHKRKGTKYCGRSCRSNAGVQRHYANNANYRETKKAQVKQWEKDNPEQTRRRKLEHYHRKTHGHLDFLNNPELRPKDPFWKARKLGFRSMLEYHVAKDLEEAGVEFSYESMTIAYDKGGPTHGEDSHI